MTRVGSMTLGMVTALLLAVACGEDDGVTPKCDDLPLYPYSEADAATNIAIRIEAEKKGCVTAPHSASGTASGGTPGTGGSAGAGGSAGTGGSAGSTPDAGGD